MTVKKIWRSIASTLSSELRTLSVDETDAFRTGWQRWYLPMFTIALVAIILVIAFLVRSAMRNSSLPGSSQGSDLVIQSSLREAMQEKEKRRMAASIGNNLTEQAPDDQWATIAPLVSDQFLKAEHSHQILAVVRDAPKHAASIESFAAKQGNLPIAKYGSLGILYAPEPEEKDAHHLAMIFYLSPDDQIRGLIIAQTPDGFKVDWASFTGESDMSNADFLHKKPTNPVLLRIHAREDDYFGYQFSKSDEFVCLRMIDNPNTATLFGYIPKGTPLAKRVEGIPVQNHEAPETSQSRAAPLTVRVKFNEGQSDTNQVEILEIVGNGWYVP